MCWRCVEQRANKATKALAELWRDLEEPLPEPLATFRTQHIVGKKEATCSRVWRTGDCRYDTCSLAIAKAPVGTKDASDAILARGLRPARMAYRRTPRVL